MIKTTESGSVPVLVQIVPDNGKSRFDIVDGQCVLYTTKAMATIGRDSLRNHYFRYIQLYLNPLPENTYVRVSHYAEDYKHLQNGTHRGSINHVTNEQEGGLSVSTKPEFPAKYAYYVTGKIIGTGTDGEPLLDVATAKPASKLMTYKQLDADFHRRQAKKLKELGLTQDDYRLLMSVTRLVFPD